MSCLPTDALSHFEQREKDLLALNQNLEARRGQAVTDASSAAQGAAAAAEAATPGYFARQALAADPLVSPALASSSRPPSGLGRSPSGGLGGGGGSLMGAAAPAAADFAFAGGSGFEALHTTIRFQNARIVALQEELDRTIRELSTRDGEMQGLRSDVKREQDEVSKMQKAAAGFDKEKEALKKQLADAESKIKSLEQEKGDLLKEKTQFDIQTRRVEADSSAKEARLNRLQEENEKYKVALKDSGSQDRDRAVQDRRETERLQTEVRKLERQRAELVNAFKKQMKLIEVLKRQRAHMEAARVLSFTEEEFIRVLELGDRLGE